MPNILRQASDLWRKFKQWLQNLNLFPSVPPSTDEYDLCTQRISTRVFIFLFTVSLMILLFYTSLKKITKTISVKEPPFIQYKQLYSTYSLSLTCPCAKISINYEEFVHIEYTLHQVCSSIFVDQRWINYLTPSSVKEIYDDDFRMRGSFAFQGLKTFCDLINRTIFDSLIDFHSRQYVSASVTPVDLFVSETKSLADQFRSSMRNSFLLSLAMIRDTTQANALLSGLQTNNQLVVENQKTNVIITVKMYGSCSCASSSTCIVQSTIHQHLNAMRYFDVPGFYTGCYVIESLLQSSLECFYNQQCIDELRAYMPLSSSMNVTALDSSLSNHYFINSTIEDLVDHLMIEQWKVSPMYERYYNRCQPIQCIYTVETRNDAIYIVTSLFGIAGGLITGLKFLVPRLVNTVRRKKAHSRSATSKSKSNKLQ